MSHIHCRRIVRTATNASVPALGKHTGECSHAPPATAPAQPDTPAKRPHDHDSAERYRPPTEHAVSLLRSKGLRRPPRSARGYLGQHDHIPFDLVPGHRPLHRPVEADPNALQHPGAQRQESGHLRRRTRSRSLRLISSVRHKRSSKSSQVAATEIVRLPRGKGLTTRSAARDGGTWASVAK